MRSAVEIPRRRGLRSGGVKRAGSRCVPMQDGTCGGRSARPALERRRK